MSLSTPQQIQERLEAEFPQFPDPTPDGALRELDRIARELDMRSKQLHWLEKQLEPVEERYEEFIANHEVGLWLKSESEGNKLPPTEKMRIRMAHLEIDAALLGEYNGLLKKRKRLESRIKSLGKQADAQRSVLSALKVEAEARG
jgi:hypothetical protein